MSNVDERSARVSSLVLRDDDVGSTVELAPARGALITRFAVAGREILYLDAATLADPRANVRGGIPILFPTPGKLADDRWTRGGASGSLKQHGYARNAAWTVGEEHLDGAASVRLRLEDGAAPPGGWPFRCHVDVVFSLAGRALRLDVRVANDGSETMPFGFGLHPYFAIADADKPRLSIPTAATRVFDNVEKKVGPFHGFDFTREVDAHLLDHGASAARLELPDGARIDLRASPEFSHWVVWSLPKKDFVCLEPWTSPGDAMNSGDRLLYVPAGAERSLFVEIELSP